MNIETLIGLACGVFVTNYFIGRHIYKLNRRGAFGFGLTAAGACAALGSVVVFFLDFL